MQELLWSFTLDPARIDVDRTQKFVTAAVAVAGLAISLYNLHKQRTTKRLRLFLHLGTLGAEVNKYSVIIANEGTTAMFVRSLAYLFDAHLNRSVQKTIHDVASGDPCFLKPGEAKVIHFDHSAKVKQPTRLIAILHDGFQLAVPTDERLAIHELQARLVRKLVHQRLVGRSFSEEHGGAHVGWLNGVTAVNDGSTLLVYGGGIWCRLDIKMSLKLRPELRRRISARRIPDWWKKSRFYVTKPNTPVAFRIRHPADRLRQRYSLAKSLNYSGSRVGICGCYMAKSSTVRTAIGSRRSGMTSRISYWKSA